MPTCTFSGQRIPLGSGLMYVLKDGKILWFKNSKSMKNFLKLKRKPLKTKWTEHYRTEHKKGVKQETVAKVEEKVAVKPVKKKALVKEEKKVPEEKKETVTEKKEGDQK